MQVETFGSMEKVEKVRFILEQMRLCLAKEDYIRTQIISKKINPKFFADENDVQQVHVLWYRGPYGMHKKNVHFCVVVCLLGCHAFMCFLLEVVWSPLLCWCVQELKLKYYQLMIEVCSHDSEYLAICKHYRAVFNTPQVQREEPLWQEVGKKCPYV